MGVSLLQNRKMEECSVRTRKRAECDRFRVYRDILGASVYADAVERAEAERIFSADVRLYLYVMAPVLTGFVSWVLEQAVVAGKRRLYFLSRDGYQMYLIALRLVRLRQLPIDCKYLYVSRYAMRVPGYHLDLQKALDQICVGGIDVTLEKILRRAALTKEEAEELAAQIGWEAGYRDVLNYRQIQELKEALRRQGGIFPCMEKHSLEAYEGAVGYLRQEGLFDPVPYAIVDSGWTGTLQETIQALLRSVSSDSFGDSSVEITADTSAEVSVDVPTKFFLEGYYFGLYELPAGADPSAYHAYYFAPEKGLRRKIYFSNSLFETICSAEEGMVEGYVKVDGRYVPRSGAAHNANRAQLQRNLEALERFLVHYERAEECRESEGCRKSKAYRGPEDDKKREDGNRLGGDELLAERLMTLLMAYPTELEVEAYGDALFSDDVLERELKKAAAELTEGEIRDQGLLRRLLIISGLKKARIRESAWIEGSIVRCGRHVKRHLCRVHRYKFFVYGRKTLRTTLRTEEKKKYTHEEIEGRTPAILFCRPADGGAGGEKKICPVLSGNRVERAESAAVNGGHVADLLNHF